MKLDFTDFLYAMSFALDAIEHEFTGATAEHGKRVAWLSMKMAERIGLSDEALIDFIGCAILHDNAVSEYLREERSVNIGADESCEKGVMEYGRLAGHAIIGERNASRAALSLPFYRKCQGSLPAQEGSYQEGIVSRNHSVWGGVDGKGI